MAGFLPTTLLTVLGDRAAAAVLAPPTGRDMLTVGLGLTSVAAVALPLGLSSGFLRPRLVRSPLRWLLGAALNFMAPGAVEEAIFRVLLIPHPVAEADAGVGTVAAWVAASTCLFLAYHLSPMHRPQRVFRDGRFLALAGALGLACAFVYRETGSLWCAAATHGLPVTVWLYALGGLEILRGP
ncbi:unnamed protein product [Ostreobium quekettii]|uniref:CAAX prenyl protease 2/Lysostaphin resistance protein A-like domain-containing protein n=1 Tax=Ostreobium quekettii TaxID=121088 RepID=A0A8S1J498_9CHLO|nr:unnamed protein product [Ostreobium quekettii]|eukprot:evm.model.scf_895.4 EVM.evm.TU.scf_895.4   scf_895:35473-36563(+)